MAWCRTITGRNRKPRLEYDAQGAVHKLHNNNWGGVSQNIIYDYCGEGAGQSITGLLVGLVTNMMNNSIIILFYINDIPSSSAHFFI